MEVGDFSFLQGCLFFIFSFVIHLLIFFFIVHATACMLRSENNLGQSVLSLYCVRPADQTQVVRLGYNDLYLAAPSLYMFLKVKCICISPPFPLHPLGPLMYHHRFSWLFKKLLLPVYVHKYIDTTCWICLVFLVCI